MSGLVHLVAAHDGRELVCSCGAHLSVYGLTRSMLSVFAEHIRNAEDDRLAQVTARAERAEAQVERVRAALDSWQMGESRYSTIRAIDVDLRAALAETETGRQEGSEAPSAAQEGES